MFYLSRSPRQHPQNWDFLLFPACIVSLQRGFQGGEPEPVEAEGAKRGLQWICSTKSCLPAMMPAWDPPTIYLR